MPRAELLVASRRKPATRMSPTWSHDGRYIYFSADPGSGRDIWRVLASGGIPERLTQGVRGYFACESADGKSLLFQPEDADTPLMAMALTGGEARQLVTCVRNSAFGAGPAGRLLRALRSQLRSASSRLDLETGRDRRLGTLDGLRERPMGLSVSPDGNTIVYPRQVLARADLMLIENFR